MDTEVTAPVVEVPASSEAAKPDAPVVEGESTKPTGDTPEEQPPKKKGGGFQKRIDKLTRENYELRARLETPRTPDKEPKRDEFEDLESYHKAIAKHTAKEALREERENQETHRRQESAKQEQERLHTSWETNVEKVSEKYDDAEDVIENFSQNVALSTAALDAIRESEFGGDVAYLLGKDEKRAAAIGRMSPLSQVREIGKLEAEIASKPVKRASSAPAPIKPVGNTGTTLKKLSEMDYDEFEKARKARISLRR